MRQRTTERVIDLPEPTIEQLAALKPPDTNMSRENTDEVAALAWELQRKELSPVRRAIVPPYSALSEGQKESCRAGVTRTVQALQLLGWIDAPS